MSGIFQASQLQHLVRDSLFEASGEYRRRVGGELQFDGERPGPDWHAHGYFSCQVWMLQDGQPTHRRVWKRRWLRKGTTQTCHSRPPDVLPGVRFCTLVVTLQLWTWIDADVGLHKVEGLQGCGSRRSMQRWLRRLLPHAMEIQQAVRLAVINRSEPRPLERIFPVGLDPPQRVRRKRWRNGWMVASLWTALAMLFGSSYNLQLPVAILLAEARGRCDRTESQHVVSAFQDASPGKRR
ncbi:MAG: hypothetical protein GXP47_12265 [Acidobacteria bacterium]|nr:hypothetical protein [Acidobacteriota bacterium]